ncbi:MAG: 50S ribosomal protein L29 [Methylophilales bacterium]|jgi:large subunit ribosomal protein L29|nr:50S ribosomal protein L29 [Pseudomonadota bacterium]NQW35322.1 50S ribosomal protein L29 [Methylophilales bacterium]HCK03280.1 50S ribosomal protein L29 [Methylophilaceae bacterium]|tara:strand:+ start:21143 stop:21337 length:195 start_codon:yes stop_codon:yes gene_type:complete
MKAIDLRKKSTEELGNELVDLRKSQFTARMKVSTQQTNKTDQLGKIKKDIARVKTILAEKVSQA